MIDVLLATCCSEGDIQAQIDALRSTGDYNIIVSCSTACAAVNRNICLRQSKSDYFIMIDDDTFGFYPGWALELARPLIMDPQVLAVSARLMGRKVRSIMDYSKPGLIMCQNYDLNQEFIIVDRIPTTCFAMRHTNLLFNEEFKGSGFEDTYFFWELKQKFPDSKLIINNNIRIKHKNEMKKQNVYWNYNQELYKKLTNGAKWHG